MLDNHEHIAGLISSFNQGKLAGPEQLELDQWVRENEYHRKLFEELTDSERLSEYFRRMEEYDEPGCWEKIREDIGLPETPVRRIFPFKRSLPFYRRIAIAATIILAIGLGAYFIINGNRKGKREEVVKTTIPHDVQAPERSKAAIILADGRSISLDSLTTITQDGVVLVKDKEGRVIYQSGNQDQGSGIIFNTLTNPRGSKVIDMKLSDGSHVWLNAGSSITYPIAFIGNERKVSMTGEAYFKIAYDKTRPFSVSKGDINVQVLGTHFNVNAYDDESDIKVTLLEGSVRVSNGIQQKTITPGEQAVFVDHSPLTIHQADLEEVMAWKNGNFQFEGAEINSVMKQLARWYDVEVEIRGNITEHFGGTISRNANVSKVFEMLKLTGEVNYKIDGRRIIVTP